MTPEAVQVNSAADKVAEVAAIHYHEVTMKANLAEEMRHLGAHHEQQCDQQGMITVQKASPTAAVMFVEFTLYLLQSSRSPLILSLKKVKIEPQQRSYNLSYPLH